MATTKTTESSVKKTTATKKAAPKKTATKASSKAVADKPAKAAAVKKAAPRKKTSKATILTSEERYKMISMAAYYIAEKNGFGDQNLEYWLAAEREVDAALNA